MGDRPISEVQENMTVAIQREIEAVARTYRTTASAVEERPDLETLGTYLTHDIEEIIDQLKRARQWEHKLESHRQGLLSSSQVAEQVDDSGPEIEMAIERAETNLGQFVDTLERLRETVEAGSSLDGRLEDLLTDLEEQRDRLAELRDVRKEVENDLSAAGISWLD